MDVECLEWNDRNFIFHFTADERVASVQQHFTLRGVLERKVSASFEQHIIGAVRCDIDVCLDGLVNMHRHGDIHAIDGHRLDGFVRYFRSVIKVDESYHVSQAVVHGQRRIFHHIREICLPQYIHVASHHEGVYGTTESSVEVYIHFAIYHSPFGAGGIQ